MDKADSPPADFNSLRLVEAILEQSDTPPCALIDKKNNIVYIHGRTGRYLEPAVGKASFNILEMARPGLKVALAAIIGKAITSRQEIILKGLEIQANGGSILVDIIVRPLREWGAMSDLVMVAFKDAAKPLDKKKGNGTVKKDKDLTRLEQELQYTKESLQTTIEELETANEELKSTNEELQSTNEELETSKEELQSLNEESATVNAELQNRISELSTTTDDMKNLLDSTQIATIFLDIDLCVRRFTPTATALIPLSVADIGRPLHHFATELKEVKLIDYAQRVLYDLAVREDNVQTLDNRTIKIRVLPYRTIKNIIDGVVITFEDISKRKHIEQELEERRVLLEAVLECTANGIVACDKNGILSYFNTTSRKFHGLPLNEIPPDRWPDHYDLYEADGTTPLPQENDPLNRALKGGTVLNQECVIAAHGLPSRKVSVTGRRLVDSKGNRLGAVVSMNDITQKR